MWDRSQRIRINHILFTYFVLCTTTINDQTFYLLLSEWIYVFYASRNKRRLFPHAAFPEWFSGAFAKLGKATVSFVMSVRPRGTTGLPLDGFWWNLVTASFFRTYVKEIQVSLKIPPERVLYMKTFSHLWQYLAEFLEWEMFQIKSFRENQNTYLCQITFFRKSYLLWDNVEKFGTAWQAADITAYAPCTLDK